MPEIMVEDVDPSVMKEIQYENGPSSKSQTHEQKQISRIQSKKVARALVIDKIWQKYDTDMSGELDYKQTKRYVKDVIGHIPEEVVL